MENAKVFFFCVLVACIGSNVLGLNSEGTHERYDELLRQQGEEVQVLKQQVALLAETVEKCGCHLSTKEDENRGKRLLSLPTAHPSPQQVAFYAYLTQNIPNLGHHHPIVFNHIHINEGNAYSSVDGEFIAPVPGLYVFSWTLSSPDRKCMESQLMKNQEVFGHLIADACNHDDYAISSGTAVTRLNTGDKVFVRTGSVHSPTLYGGGGLSTPSFTGFLLH